jgi:hypothetical protein
LPYLPKNDNELKHFDKNSPSKVYDDIQEAKRRIYVMHSETNRAKHDYIVSRRMIDWATHYFVRFVHLTWSDIQPIKKRSVVGRARKLQFPGNIVGSHDCATLLCESRVRIKGCLLLKNPATMATWITVLSSCFNSLQFLQGFLKPKKKL